MMWSRFGPLLVSGYCDGERIPRWMAAGALQGEKGPTTKDRRDIENYVTVFRDKFRKDIIKATDGIRHCEDPVKIAHHDIYGQPSVKICYYTHFDRLIEAVYNEAGDTEDYLEWKALEAVMRIEPQKGCIVLEQEGPKTWTRARTWTPWPHHVLSSRKAYTTTLKDAIETLKEEKETLARWAKETQKDPEHGFCEKLHGQNCTVDLH